MSAALAIEFILGHLFELASASLQAQLSELLRKKFLVKCQVLFLSSPSYWEIWGAIVVFFNCDKMLMT